MSEAAPIQTKETPSAALVRVVAELDQPKRVPILEALRPMFERADEWRAEASHLQVTGEGQEGKEKRARILRLEIRNVRSALDKRRKQMKAGILLETRAIDGAFAIFEAESVPLEAWLKEQETFSERKAAERCDALRDARIDVLLGLGTARAALPASLGEMSEETWLAVRDDAQRAKDARDQLVREAEEVRIESERIVAERRVKEEADRKQREAERLAEEARQREENERLRAEADAARVTAEALAVAAREEADAAHRTAEGERVAREKAESDLRAKEQSEDAARARAEEERLEGLRLAQEEEQRRKLAGERGRFLEIATSIRSMAQTLDVIDEEAIQTKAGKSLGVKVRKRLMEVAADIERAADRLATGEAS